MIPASAGASGCVITRVRTTGHRCTSSEVFRWPVAIHPGKDHEICDVLHQQNETPSETELPAVWRRRAIELRRYGAEAQATTLECAADDLDAALRRRDDELLTLSEAATESGYHAESLGRLVLDGKIPNAGRKGAPRIQRRDLPHKPKDVAVQPATTYDPVADARALRGRSRRSA